MQANMQETKAVTNEETTDAAWASIIERRKDLADPWVLYDKHWDELLSDSHETLRSSLKHDKPYVQRNEQVPFYVDPDPRSIGQILSTHIPFETRDVMAPETNDQRKKRKLNERSAINSIYGPIEYDGMSLDFDGANMLGRNAYNLGGYFDLSDRDNLRAYYIKIPGYNDKQWATVLPMPTDYYASSKFNVDHAGDFTNCVQHENYLFRSHAVTNGRCFVSFPGGIGQLNAIATKRILRSECPYSLIGYQDFGGNYLDKVLRGDAVDELTVSGNTTFWMVLRDARRPYFTYTIRMESPSNENDEANVTAWGMLRPSFNGSMQHDILDLRHLNGVNDPEMVFGLARFNDMS